MDPICPKCRTDSFLSKRYSLLLDFSDWPTLALATLVVILAGNLLAAASEAIAIGGLLATAPLFLCLLEKHHCERCDIEFRCTTESEGEVARKEVIRR